MPIETTSTLDRRSLMKTLLAAAALTGTSFSIIKPAEAKLRMPERKIHLYNTHTGEFLKTTYWAEGRYLGRELHEAAHLLRDHRNDDMHPIDPKLLDYLSTVTQRFGVQKPVEVISGYRSPESNSMLERTTSGVAHNSLHMSGRAIDIRIPGKSIRQVSKVAKSLRLGGVGTYHKSQFVHLDTGKFRTW